MSVTTLHVKLLEERPDFQQYLEDLNKGPVEAARAKYLSRIPRYVDAYDEAITKMQEAGEFKDVAAAVQPAIDRVVPKRGDIGAAVQINVTLSPKRLAGLNEYQPAEVEALPAGDEPDPST